MPRRRSFRRRGGFRRARSFIRRTVVNMGPIDAKRIILNGSTIPDITSVAYDNPLEVTLITATESVDEELESNGSNVAQVRPYSKIVGLKWHGYIQGAVSEALNVRWMLLKEPDGENLVTSLTDANFHSSDDTPTQREVRGQILAKGIMHLNESKGATPFNLFVRRKTLSRLGHLRENDNLTLLIALDAAATTQPKLFAFGTIYVRHN